MPLGRFATAVRIVFRRPWTFGLAAVVVVVAALPPLPLLRERLLHCWSAADGLRLRWRRRGDRRVLRTRHTCYEGSRVRAPAPIINVL
jgi:hypothetical protein